MFSNHKYISQTQCICNISNDLKEVEFFSTVDLPTEKKNLLFF